MPPPVGLGPAVVSAAPMALVGATSDEARLVARRIARLADVPFLVLDVSRLQDDALRRSSPSGPDLVLPPDPVIALASSGCANPLILVLGAEHAPERIASGLGDLLDRQSSSRWFCEVLGTPLDLSAITWMVATSNEHALHTDLYSRLIRLSIAVPDDLRGRRLRVLGVALEVMADHELEREEVAPALAAMLGDPDRAWQTMSRCAAGALYKAVARQLLHAAHGCRS